MPHIYAHRIAAESVLSRLSGSMGAIQRNAYFIGAQGPDPFFYERIFNSALNIGTLLHQQDVDRSLSLLYACAMGDETLRSYFCGYLCHYALDQTAHPFIYAKSCTNDHTRYETQLDMALMEHCGKSVIDTPPRAILPVDQKAVKMISNYYDRALKPVWDNIEEGLFERAYGKMLLVQRLASDKTGMKGSMLRGIEKCAGKAHYISGKLFDGKVRYQIDYLNLAQAPWSPPWSGLERTETFLDLLESAVVLAETLCAAAMDAWARRQSAAPGEFGAKNFNTGMDWRTPADLNGGRCVFSASGCTIP